MSDDAAAKRADYVRALRAERDGYARIGDKVRAAEVDAELARFDGAPKKRTSKKPATTEG